MRPVFFLREALRALKRNAIPSFAAMATVLVTVTDYKPRTRRELR